MSFEQKAYHARDQAKADVFDYIERFYYPKRQHSTIVCATANQTTL
jgi:hypothetical protein